MRALQIKVGAHKEFLHAGKSISSFPLSVCPHVCQSVSLCLFLSVSVSLRVSRRAAHFIFPFSLSLSARVSFFPFSHSRCLLRFISPLLAAFLRVHLFSSSPSPFRSFQLDFLYLALSWTTPLPRSPKTMILPSIPEHVWLTVYHVSVLPLPLVTSCSCWHCTWESERG